MFNHLPSCSIIFNHLPSFSIIFHHVQSSSIMFNHFQSSSIMFNHLPSCSIIFNHLPSFSIIFHHVQSFSIMFNHVHISKWSKTQSSMINLEFVILHGPFFTISIFRRLGGRRAGGFLVLLVDLVNLEDQRVISRKSCKNIGDVGVQHKTSRNASSDSHKWVVYHINTMGILFAIQFSYKIQKLKAW